MIPPDWPAVIRYLQAKGLTQKAIAQRAGVDQATVCRLADGRAPEPRFSVALALIELAGGAAVVEAELGIRIPASAQSDATATADAERPLELVDRRVEQQPIEFPDRRAATRQET